jgi:hypothetical protein
MPSEVSFTEAPSGETATITAGPVPETAPGLAVSLQLDIQGGTLVRAQALMASGASYRFTATRRTGY